VTLWSRVAQVIHLLTELNLDLSPHTSRIAVISNLYGNGLPQMLRNLLWNPQIVHILVLGQNLSGSQEELVNFFQCGLEPVEYLGVATYRIKGTSRIIDGEVQPHDFKNGLRVEAFGKLNETATRESLLNFFKNLPPPPTTTRERIQIPMPKTETVQRYPSEPRSHTILRKTPLEAWEELVFRLVRFGHHTSLKKGLRIELPNVKVIIEEPEEASAATLREYGFSLSHFQEYQQTILNPQPPTEQTYTYGHRIRSYFQQDALAIAVQRLNEDRESRHAYVSLWDSFRDLPAGHDCPCLVSLFFRYFEEKLTLTATFRTHNAMDAWLENVYGLMAILTYVAERTHLPTGSITLFSHSLSISGEALEKAKLIANRKVSDEVRNPQSGHREPRYDHHGNFIVTIDHQEIVVQHLYQGAVIKEYRGTTAAALEKQLARDCAISEISHALYLGREIARKEYQLKSKNRKVCC